jgi:hypothetical protein
MTTPSANIVDTFVDYRSIFKHYEFDNDDQQHRYDVRHIDNEQTRKQVTRYNRHDIVVGQQRTRERNTSNQRTTTNKKTRVKNDRRVPKIVVPDATRSRQTTHR